MPNWNEVLSEINETLANSLRLSQNAPDMVRRKYLAELHKNTGRNLITYYSGWLSKPGVPGLDINDEDLNGFMMAIHNMDRSLGLDLILHTPGGSIAATETIVHYLRQMFGENIRVIVPQMAMSAGTMIACCCKEILMAKHSCLGPIDPQINGLPVHGILEELERAYAEVKDNPATAHIWGPIIGKYPLSFISQCENAVLRAEEFVCEELSKIMFANETKPAEKAQQVCDALTDFRGNKAHDKHIHYEKCQEIGLNVSLIEENQVLQDLILTVHHCNIHSLTNTPSFKIIENQNGAAFVKNIGYEQVTN